MTAFNLEDIRKEYDNLKLQLEDYEQQYNRIMANDGHTAKVRSIEFSFKDRTVEVFRPSKHVPLLLEPFIDALRKTIEGLRQSMALIREEWGKEINFEEDGKEQV